MTSHDLKAAVDGIGRMLAAHTGRLDLYVAHGLFADDLYPELRGEAGFAVTAFYDQRGRPVAQHAASTLSEALVAVHAELAVAGYAGVRAS